jgi:hypothetical protein
VIGAGKSTTAKCLAARLMEEGRSVHAFHEFADNHPIRTPGVDLVRTGARAPESMYDPSQWNALADRCAQGANTIILESTFLQNSVLPRFVEDAPTAVVKELFAEITRRLVSAAPVRTWRASGMTVATAFTYGW